MPSSKPKFDSAMPSSGSGSSSSNAGKEIKVSLIDQTTALDKGGVTRTITEDIMHHPTVGGKVYAATGYATQMMLAAGGLVVFGGIAYSLFGNMAKKTGPTRMFGYAMDRLNKNPQTEIHLGMPIKGFGEEQGRRRSQMAHSQYKKPGGDPTTYTYLKFYVEGKKNEGVVHFEYADGELHYMIVEVPRTGKNFAIEDNRREHKVKIEAAKKEYAAEQARKALERKADEAREAASPPGEVLTPPAPVFDDSQDKFPPPSSSDVPLQPMSGGGFSGPLDK